LTTSARRARRSVCLITHLDSQICVQQHLHIKRLRVVVRHHQLRDQPIPIKRHAVDQAERKRPGRAALRVHAFAAAAKTKVQLDREVGGRTTAAAAARGAGLSLRRRLAEEVPLRVARESVLRELGRLRVVGGGAENLDVETGIRLVQNAYAQNGLRHGEQQRA
jgi:hypothetical protein